MSDLLLGPSNDLVIINGQLQLITTVETLTRQRLVNKLRTFTGTLFTNVDYGIDVNLVFERGTQDLLDQHLKTLISDTPGIDEIVEFSSEVINRVYRCTFRYKIETGEITGVSNLSLSGESSGAELSNGIWVDGYWDYTGTWDNKDLWGTSIKGEQSFVYLDTNPLEQYPESLYTAPIFAPPRGTTSIDELDATYFLESSQRFVKAGITYIGVSKSVYFEVDMLKSIQITNSTGLNEVKAFLSFSDLFFPEVDASFTMVWDEATDVYSVIIDGVTTEVSDTLVRLTYNSEDKIVTASFTTAGGEYSAQIPVQTEDASTLPIGLQIGCYTYSAPEEIQVSTSIYGRDYDMTYSVPEGSTPLLASFTSSEFIPPTRNF